MQYFGELISLGVAFSWTITALASEVGSKRLGVLSLNVWRLGLAMVCSAALMWVVTGNPLPAHASGTAWFWLMLSGVVGYFFGDWCLFNSYLCFGDKLEGVEKRGHFVFEVPLFSVPPTTYLRNTGRRHHRSPERCIYGRSYPRRWQHTRRCCSPEESP